MRVCWTKFIKPYTSPVVLKSFEGSTKVIRRFKLLVTKLLRIEMGAFLLNGQFE